MYGGCDGAKLLIVNLNISLCQPWKVHGLHEFIFQLLEMSKCQNVKILTSSVTDGLTDGLTNMGIHKAALRQLKKRPKKKSQKKDLYFFFKYWKCQNVKILTSSVTD